MPGYVGATAGSIGGKAIAKKLGASDVVSDVIGGIGGAIGGFFSPVATGGGVKKKTESSQDKRQTNQKEKEKLIFLYKLNV